MYLKNICVGAVVEESRCDSKECFHGSKTKHSVDVASNYSWKLLRKLSRKAFVEAFVEAAELPPFRGSCLLLYGAKPKHPWKCTRGSFQIRGSTSVRAFAEASVRAFVEASVEAFVEALLWKLSWK